MFVGAMPAIDFVNGNGEDVLASFQMGYKDGPAFFNDADYRLVVVPPRVADGIEFSSADGATNSIDVVAIDDPDHAGQSLVNFTFRAPWRSVFGRSGLHSGNLQIKNSSGIFDIAIVSITIEKRPTFSET